MIWTLGFPLVILLVTLLFYPKPRPSSDKEKSIRTRNLVIIYAVYLLACIVLISRTSMIATGFTFLAIVLLPIARLIKLPRWVFVPILCVICFRMVYNPVMSAREYEREIESLQLQYPLVSLAPRLNYETETAAKPWQYVSTSSANADNAGPPGDGSVSEHKTPPLLADIPEPLRAPPAPGTLLMIRVSYDETFDEVPYARFENPDDRRIALAVVHDLWTMRFNQLLGNGVYRMPFMRDWQNHLEDEPDPQKLYLPDEYTPAEQFEDDVLAALELLEQWKFPDSAQSDSPDSQTGFVVRGLGAQALESDLLREEGVHSRSVLDFVNRPGWGFIRSREQVAGFRSHRFRNRPVVLDTDTQQLDDWRITKLELVSLLKHDTPQVYQEEGLPNLETIPAEEIPTRDLDSFERKALHFLQQGQDVVLDEQPAHIRMFGSLRAVGECLQCHDVPRQTLLGAFSYELKKPAVSVSHR